MTQQNRPLDSIDAAIEDIRQGKLIIVVDDEDRENEGDFVAAARFATPELINFMAVEGRGLICAPLIEDRCDELDLELMVNRNNAAFETPFTVSVDLVGKGCTTGFSAQDRAKTVQALIDPNTRPNELGRPGHIFPLRARRGGVLRRAGHTEAAIDLARLAGLEPAGVIVEIMNPDGTMARLPELLKMAEKFDLRIVSIEDLIAYRLANDTLIQRTGEKQIQTAQGEFTMITYRQTTSEEEHFALIRGEWKEGEAIPVRVHASQPRFDLLNTSDFGRGDVLQMALERMSDMEQCAFVYLENGTAPWSAVHDLPEGIAAADPTQVGVGEAELKRRHGRTYGLGAQILRDLGIRNLQLISDTAKVTKGMSLYGIEISEVLPLRKS
jgi:3,4-dihydroxy 2-butanone 4-phosphate synthase/GTP cyclohydrolase II